MKFIRCTKIYKRVLFWSAQIIISHVHNCNNIAKNSEVFVFWNHNIHRQKIQTHYFIPCRDVEIFGKSILTKVFLFKKLGTTWNQKPIKPIKRIVSGQKKYRESRVNNNTMRSLRSLVGGCIKTSFQRESYRRKSENRANIESIVILDNCSNTESFHNPIFSVNFSESNRACVSPVWWNNFSFSKSTLSYLVGKYEEEECKYNTEFE